MLRCRQGGPYVALATVGPSAVLHRLSGRQIGCPWTQESVKRLTKAEYIARADVICTAATARFLAEAGLELEDMAVWSRAAARASEGALTELRALSPPEAGRARVNQVLSLMEQQTDVLHQLAWAASAGETARARMFSSERIDLTHQKYEHVVRLSSLWGVSPDVLEGCPVGLPA